MLKQIIILAIHSYDGFGTNFKNQDIQIDIPDQWGALDSPAKEAMDNLLVHSTGSFSSNTLARTILELSSTKTRNHHPRPRFALSGY
jgi:hypothetical protein